MTKPDEKTLAALRVRIAEMCGYVGDSEKIWFDDPSGLPCPRHGLPAYCRDLNAIHKAEAALIRTLDQGVAFMESLELVVEPTTSFDLHHATALERAVALDRTLSEKPIL